MGRRGAAAAPAALKLLHGTSPGRDSGGRPVAKPPAFEKGAPTAPDWLDGAALDVWTRVVAALEPLNLLKPEDGELLASYCLTWQTIVDTTAIINTEGYTATNPDSGRVSAHPAVAVRASAIRDMRPLAAQFGLSPWTESNLASLATDDTDDDDPFDGRPPFYAR